MSDIEGGLASDDHADGDAGADIGPVVYATESIGLKAKRVKRLRLAFGFTLFTVIIVLAISSVVVNEYPVVFGVGAILLVQSLIIAFRARRSSEPVVTDPEVEARVSPILIELCRAAGCPLPKVSIRRTLIQAAVIGQPQKPPLLISPDFLAAVDDRALRAILAHEVVHPRGDDLAATKRRSQMVFLVAYAGGLLVVFTVGHGSGIAFLLWMVYFFPCVQLYLRFTGLQVRQRETRADLAGAAAICDPEGMIRGLEIVYRLTDDARERLFGGSNSKWMFFPWSLRPRTHPSLVQRIARLRSLAMTELMTT
jgi:Zn-dependent protease with chaperone function